MLTVNQCKYHCTETKLFADEELFTFSAACFPPQVTLIPATSSISSPIQVRRYQDFYLTSIIQLNCNNSLDTRTQWTINNSSLKSALIITTSSELFIPARSLSEGNYEISPTVTMTISPNLSSSASVYLRITSSGITHNLVQLGTSMITSGHHQDLQLDPGLHSIDLDGNDFNASVIHPASTSPCIFSDDAFHSRIGITHTFVASMER